KGRHRRGLRSRPPRRSGEAARRETARDGRSRLRRAPSSSSTSRVCSPRAGAQRGRAAGSPIGSRTRQAHAVAGKAELPELAGAGWLGIVIPEEYGGTGLGILEASLMLEEVAASGACMNGASALHMSIFGMHPVVKHGSDELKQRTLPRIVSGDLHVCFGVTE